jgi:DHA2 family multidrug resistance protein
MVQELNPDSVSGKPKPRRLRARVKDATRSAILDAAEQVFARHGINAGRMEQVADQAGVSVGTLYNHFADRRALVTSLLEARRAELLARVDDAVEHAPAQPIERLRALLGSIFEHVEKHRAFLSILVQEGAGESVAAPNSTYRKLEARVRAILAPTRSKGKGNADVTFLSHLVTGSVKSAMIFGIIERRTLDPRRDERAHPARVLPEGRCLMSAPAIPAALSRPSFDNKWLVTVAISFGALMATIDLIDRERGAASDPWLDRRLDRRDGRRRDVVRDRAGDRDAAHRVRRPLLRPEERLPVLSRPVSSWAPCCAAWRTRCSRSSRARALQGLGAGALQPTQQAILRQTFPPEEQGMAMAMFVMVVVIGPAIGPTLGGWIVDNWSWPWIFFINLPVGVLGILMVIRFVHEPEDIRRANREVAAVARKNLDWQGIVLMSIGFATMQYVLEEGPREDWFDSPLITVAVLVAAASLVGFVVREFTARAPAVNLRLFRDPVFSAATAIGGVMFAILMANMFLLPVFMQELLGFTALQSGLALMPRSLAMMVATPLVGRFYNRTPPQLFVALGVLCVALGSWQMGSFTLATSPHDIWMPLIVQGIGFSLLFVPLTTVALSNVQRRDIADASGLTALMRQLGGSIGLAIFTTLLTQFVVVAQAGLAAHLDPSRLDVQRRLGLAQAAFMHRGMDANTAHAAALRAMGGMVARQAQLIAFDKSFQLGALLMVALLPLVLFLRRPRTDSEPGSTPHLEVEAA